MINCMSKVRRREPTDKDILFEELWNGHEKNIKFFETKNLVRKFFNMGYNYRMSVEKKEKEKI